MSIATASFAFARKWSDTYVETGAYIGGSLRGAIDAGFKHLYTCEANADFMVKAMDEGGRPGGRVHYYFGESPAMLPLMLAAAGVPCSILLDAHGIRLEADSFRASDPFPLLKELAVLRTVKYNNHLIMVDDIDQCWTPKMGNIPREDVEAALKAINPDYTLRIMDGVRPQMLLVAVPPGYDKVAV